MSNHTDEKSPILMATIINDRTVIGSGHTGSSTSVDRVKQKNKRLIQEKVRESLNKDSITDIGKGKDMDISLPKDTFKEYSFRKGSGGDSDRVHPGNDQFHSGDIIERPQSGGAGGPGPGASNSGEGDDEFQFQISQDEYLDVLFEDLELPNMDLDKIAKAIKFKYKRIGVTTSGMPERLDVSRTFTKNKGRKISLGLPKLKLTKAMLEKTLKYVDARLEGKAVKETEELKLAAEITLGAVHLKNSKRKASKRKSALNTLLKDSLEAVETVHQLKRYSKAAFTTSQKSISELFATVSKKMKRLRKSLSIDPSIDGIYANMAKVPVPSENAAMFCLMDVSGSMDEETKDIAKRFYVLLYLFLSRTYDPENIEIIFIRHTTEAKEVDEEEFFHGRETGGTEVSSALKLFNKIQQERFPASEWNVYVAQASDGDNWGHDTAICVPLVTDMLKERVRHYIYVEITDGDQQNLWEAYEGIVASHSNMAMAQITDKSQIVPVFRNFFLKDKSS